jgi:hypothetical protein
MQRGFWRHSATTIETHRCKSFNEWSPCLGGMNATATEGTPEIEHGSGYCERSRDGGYFGIRCESCAAEDHYFDKLDARCRACGDLTPTTAPVVCALVFFFVAAAVIGSSTTAGRKEKHSTRYVALRKLIHKVHEAWNDSGMRFKGKGASDATQTQGLSLAACLNPCLHPLAGSACRAVSVRRRCTKRLPS